MVASSVASSGMRKRREMGWVKGTPVVISDFNDSSGIRIQEEILCLLQEGGACKTRVQKKKRAGTLARGSNLSV
jgi:hypothetical protein